METIKVIDYSDKAIVITGDTKPIKEQLKTAFMGAIKWNSYLKDKDGNPFKGWVLSKKHEPAVRELLQNLLPKPDTSEQKVVVNQAPVPVVTKPINTAKPKPRQSEIKQPIVTPNWQLPVPPQN